MEYTIELQENQRLVMVYPSGDATLSGFKAWINALFQPPYKNLNYNVLVDLRNLNMAPLSSSDVWEITNLVTDKYDVVLAAKLALVVSQELAFGIARMYELLIQERDPQITRVFYQYDEAIDWLCADQLAPDAEAEGAGS